MHSRANDALHLSVVNAHERDSRIVFDEPSHTYWVDGKAVGLSVTGLIKLVESEHFDAVAQATRLSERPTARYCKVLADGSKAPLSISEILKRWDDARDLGTDLHGRIERYLNGIEIEFESGDAVNVVEFTQFYNWWQKQLAAGYEAYRTEMVIFDEDRDIAGSIDFLMRNTKTGEICIVDWKRCLTNVSNFSSAWKGKRMLPPLDNFEETKLNHWKIQVNIYRLILEAKYGFKIADMRMVVLYKDQTEALEFFHDSDDSVGALFGCSRS